jgi:hypothetical protein
MLLHSLLPLLGVFFIIPALAQQAGTFHSAGNTQVSAMMVRMGTWLFCTAFLSPTP